MNIPRIVVADQQPLCRSGLSGLLKERFDIGEIVQASDFPHALVALNSAPETTIMTVNMNLPALNGVAGLHKLRAEFPSVLLVVVAESRERDQVLAALCAGVHGYILKATPAEEIWRAFESILSGHVYVPPLVSDVASDSSSASVVLKTARQVLLTDRQFQVLQLVAAGRSNKEIARALLIAESTVKVHINAAFRTLGVHNRVSAAAALQIRPRNDNGARISIADASGNDPPVDTARRAVPAKLTIQ